MDVDSGSLQSIRDSTQNPANHAPSVAGGRDRANQTSMKTKLSIGGMGLVSALACVTGTPPAAVAAPRALSYEEKVLASDYVIIGTVIRIICREYDPARHRVLDVEDERCNDGWSRTTTGSSKPRPCSAARRHPIPMCSCASLRQRNCARSAGSAAITAAGK